MIMLPKPPQKRKSIVAAKVYTSLTLANLFRDVDKMNLLVLFSLRKEPKLRACKGGLT